MQVLGVAVVVAAAVFIGFLGEPVIEQTVELFPHT